MINYLYIHLPFCIKKCIYCDFLSVPYDNFFARRYVEALDREFFLRKEITGKLKSVYIGGGTPTVLPAESFARLFASLRESFEFYPDAEITVEANPGTIDEDKIQILLSLGVNRLSIGVQSFVDKELLTLGRTHSSDEALRAVDIVKKSRIKNFSIDLIYAIPGQTPESWGYTISRALEFSPEHISTYELTPEHGTPLHEALKEKKLMMPGEEIIVEMYNYTIDTLIGAGYRHYEISNFAKEGLECIHNLNYWNRGEYIGIGAGAHSFWSDKRIKNTVDIKKYIELLNYNQLPIDESIEISCEDALKEIIFLGLRKTEGINMRGIEEELGVKLHEAAEDLLKEGLIEIDGSYLRLARKGLVLSNEIIVRLFEKLGI